MNKVYLIDSENVNDAWVKLLPALEETDRIIVFYTAKSPHMCYQNVIQLIHNEKEIEFIKCFEGNNALDFQLVSQLGFLLCENPECKYFIVSNDTGFDAIVKYWKKRSMIVTRIKGKDCYAIVKKSEQKTDDVDLSEDDIKETDLQEEQHKDDSFDESNEAEVAVDDLWEEVRVNEKEEDTKADSLIMEEAEPLDQKQRMTECMVNANSDRPLEDAECVLDILNVISLNRMALFHNALTCIFNQKQGDFVYSFIKENRKDYMGKKGSYIPKKKEREKYYIMLILQKNGVSKEESEEISKFYVEMPKKDLKSVNSAILKKYGKDKGNEYYSIIKKHSKVIGKL